MNPTFLARHLWLDAVVAAVQAWRKPKGCTSCNELTYTTKR